MNEYLLGRNGRIILLIYAWILILFIFVPALVLIPVSLGKEEGFTVIPNDLSLHWYETLLSDPRWRNALFLSLKLAAFSTVVATVLGVLAAVGLSRSTKFAKGLRLLFIAPMIVPLMVLGVGFYILFAKFRLVGSFYPLGLAHAILILPYVILPITARLYSMDQRLEWAAASLGASPSYTLRRVTLPLLMPSIIAGASFAFIFSFDEVVVAQFLSGPRLETLPRRMWEGIQMGGLDKTITAVTSLQLFIAAFGMLFITLWQRLSARRDAAARRQAQQ